LLFQFGDLLAILHSSTAVTCSRHSNATAQQRDVHGQDCVLLRRDWPHLHRSHRRARCARTFSATFLTCCSTDVLTISVQRPNKTKMHRISPSSHSIARKYRQARLWQYHARRRLICDPIHRMHISAGHMGHTPSGVQRVRNIELIASCGAGGAWHGRREAAARGQWGGEARAACDRTHRGSAARPVSGRIDQR
jgi:hypothetical protein